MKALQGEAKRKYFEHAGALLTVDGTDDDLIKLEGAPRWLQGGDPAAYLIFYFRVAAIGARYPVQTGQARARGSPISPVYGWVLSLVSEARAKLRIFIVFWKHVVGWRSRGALTVGTC